MVRNGFGGLLAIEEGRIHWARRNCIHGDTALAKFLGSRPRVVLDRCLASSVRRVVAREGSQQRGENRANTTIVVQVSMNSSNVDKVIRIDDKLSGWRNRERQRKN